MTDKEKEFYEECMDCRQISWGSLEGDDINYFYKLINEYADKKFENAKCCATCRHSVEGDANLFENCGICK